MIKTLEWSNKMTTIFRGKGELPGQSKPIQTIAQYGSQLKKHLTQGGTNMAKNSETVIRRPRFVRINILQTTHDEVNLIQK